MGRTHKRSHNNAPEFGANAFLIKGMMQMLQEQIKASEPKVRRKRKPSRYNIFMSEEMTRLKAIHGDSKSHKVIFKMATEAWKKCDDACKTRITPESTFSKIKTANRLMKQAREITDEGKTRSPKTRTRTSRR